MIRRAVPLRTAAITLALGLTSPPCRTAQQTQAPKSSRFEVAAIRPGNPGTVNSLIHRGLPGGQYRMTNVPLKQWVELGLSVPEYALSAPSWLDTSRFDLVAKPPAGESASPAMLKALLIERFGLKWHEELSTVQGYNLVVDKKLLAPPATLLERLHGPASGSGPTMINGKNLPMSRVAELLAEVLGRPVVDQTHVSGGFDIELRWRADNDAAVAQQKRYGIDVDSLPDSVFTAVREQLGLRLQPAKVPSKVIVVDQINRQPTGN